MATPDRQHYAFKYDTGQKNKILKQMKNINRTNQILYPAPPRKLVH